MIEPIHSADEFAEMLGQALRERGYHKIKSEQAVSFPRFREDSFKLGPLVDFVKNFRHNTIEIGSPSIIGCDDQSHPMFDRHNDIVQVGYADLVDPLVFEISSSNIYEYAHDGDRKDRQLISHSSEWFLAGILAVARAPVRVRFESIEQIRAVVAPLRKQELFLHRMTGAEYPFFQLTSFKLEFTRDPPIQFLPNFALDYDTMFGRLSYFPEANPSVTCKRVIGGPDGWSLHFMDRRHPGHLFIAKYRTGDSTLSASVRSFIRSRGRMKQRFNENDAGDMAEALEQFFNSFIS